MMEYIDTDHLLSQVAAQSRADEAFELIRTFKLHRRRQTDHAAQTVIFDVWYSPDNGYYFEARNKEVDIIDMNEYTSSLSDAVKFADWAKLDRLQPWSFVRPADWRQARCGLPE